MRTRRRGRPPRTRSCAWRRGNDPRRALRGARRLLYRRHAPALGSEGEHLLDASHVFLVEDEVAGERVVAGVVATRRHRNREKGRPAHEVRECDLMRRGAVARRDRGENSTGRSLGIRQAALREGAVTHHSDAVLLARGDDTVLDGALAEMVEDLVAGDAPTSGRTDRLLQALLIEVADAVA